MTEFDLSFGLQISFLPPIGILVIKTYAQRAYSINLYHLTYKSEYTQI